MQEKYVRIKNNLLLIEDKEELLVMGSYGKAVVIPITALTYQLLNHLATECTKRELLRKLSKGLAIPQQLAQKLITRLSKAGMLEVFTKKEISDVAYTRYQTQLSFFDLLQPGYSLAKKLQLQQQLHHLHIVIIGIGGIGNYAAQSFAAMGVGEITLVDNDRVDHSNLNRQILFGETDIGKHKTTVAAKELQNINSSCRVNTVNRKIRNRAGLQNILKQAGAPALVFISADTMQLPLWMNTVEDDLAYPFIKASYQGSTGFIGPLVVPGGRLYTDIVPVEKTKESAIVKKINQKHKHASFSPVNAVIANLAVLESVKFLLHLPQVAVKEKRLFFDFAAIEISAG